MVRSVLAVIAGYLIFGISAGVLFALSGRDPHARPTPAFAAGAVAYGLLFGALAGFVAASIASRRRLVHAAVVAAIIGAIGLLSLAFQQGNGSVWTELATACLFAPAALAGGWLRARRATESARA